MKELNSTETRNRLIKDRVYTLALALYISGYPTVRKLAHKYSRKNKSLSNSMFLKTLLASSNTEIKELIEKAVEEQKDIERFRKSYLG